MSARIGQKELQDFWFTVRGVVATMDRAGERLFRDSLGIGLTQFLVLSVVDAFPGEFNQQSVADRLQIAKATVSRQIDIAVSAGYMTSRPSTVSRRENVLELTASGTDLVRRGDAALVADRSINLPDVSPEDFAVMMRTLRALGGLPDDAPA